MSAARFPDWPERLAGYIERCSAVPFAWGGQDCVGFALGAVEAMTGENPASTQRWAWKDERSARRLVRRLGGIQTGAVTLWGSPQPPLMASRGDMMLLAGDTLEHALGVCVGDRIAAAGPEGVVLRPLDAAECCWRVG